MVGVLALLTVVLAAQVVPGNRSHVDASPLRELGALARGQVWLTLAIGAVGFGGMFAVYTYLASTLAEVMRAPAYAAPLVFAVFGVGMTLGDFVVPRFADRVLMPTAGAPLAWSAVALAIYPFAAANIPTIMLAVLAIGLGGALGTVLQARLMDVAGDAQGLAASGLAMIAAVQHAHHVRGRRVVEEDAGTGRAKVCGCV